MKPLICLVAAALLAACAGFKPEPLRVTVGETQPLPGVNGVGVGITLTNPSRRPTKQVTVSCTYFDAAGAAVGSGLVYFNKVAAGGSDTVNQLVVAPGASRGDCAVRQPAR